MKAVKFIVLGFCIILWSCSSEKKTQDDHSESTLTEVKAPLTVDGVVAKYDSLNSVVQYYWDTLTKMDDEKFVCLNRLYEEMEIMPKSNSFKVRRLKKQIPGIISSRYDQYSMTSEEIDAYDAATDTLIFNTYKLASQTEDFENYPVALEMLNEIKVYNGDLFVTYRTNYSVAAQALNDFVTENNKALKAKGVDIREIPTFFVYE